MSNHNSGASVPIVKDGKDICRLIFTKADKGRYDLKLDFLGNSFQVQAYRLFSQRPIVWDVSESKNNMSYHYGKDEKPVVIHIKNEKPAEGGSRYITLPIHRIQSPNINQLLPLPLLKLEVPDCVIEKAKVYRPKPYHRAIDLEDSNVLELFMLPEGRVNQYTLDKYETIFHAWMIASFEFYATDTVLSDYQKYANFIPHGKPEARGIGMTKLQGMDLYASIFPDRYVSTERRKLTVTFIENELAEPILLNGLVRTRSGGDGTYFGGASYERLDFCPSGKPIGLIEDSVAAWTMKEPNLSDAEKAEIFRRAVAGRISLKNELKKYNTGLGQEERKLKKAAVIFMNGLQSLQDQCLSRHRPHSGEDGYRATDEDLWLMEDFLFHAIEIHILFMKFMNVEHYTLVRRKIQSKCYSPPPLAEKEYDSDGYEVKVFHQLLPHEVCYCHVWLEYNDHFDVDLLRGGLNYLLTDGGKREPDILVARGSLTSHRSSWSEVEKRLLQSGFVCGSMEVLHIGTEETGKWLDANNSLLGRIYRRIFQDQNVNRFMRLNFNTP